MSRVASHKYNIALHDTLAQETHRNGKDVSTHYVVVKNTPFLINISSKEPAHASFRKTKITASLAYDCEPRREVTLIRSSPLEYVTHLSSNGELITIEARIHVLTSQNENSLFRVCLKFNDDELTTEPLKVISKADNLKKAKDKPAPSKKRTSGDAFGDTLQRIEQHQQEQKSLIDMLYQQNQQLMAQLQQQSLAPLSPPRSPSHAPFIPSPQDFPISSPPSPDTTTPSTSTPSSTSTSTSTSTYTATDSLQECTKALRRFLDCYKNISCDERPQKIRLISSLVSSTEQSLRSTMDCFARDLMEAQRSVVPSTADAPLVFTPMDSLFDDGAIPSISSPENDGYWSSSPLSSPSYLSSPSSPSLDDTGLEQEIFSDLFSVSADCTFSF